MKPILYIISVILIAGLFTGCASVSVSPPDRYQIEADRIFNADYDLIWRETVIWFARRDIRIDRLAKDSGIITIEPELDLSNLKYLDHGAVSISGTIGEDRIFDYATMNVTIQQIDECHVMVSIHIFGTYTIRVKDAWDSSIKTVSGTSVSTGLAEKELLDYLSRAVEGMKQ